MEGVVNDGILTELMRRLQELTAAEKEGVAKLHYSDSLGGYAAKNPKSLMPWNDHLLHKIWPLSCIDYRSWPKNPQCHSSLAFTTTCTTSSSSGSLRAKIGIVSDGGNECWSLLSASMVVSLISSPLLHRNFRSKFTSKILMNHI
ncbi:unnamed protein product [Thlaspi arvense]|uniref:Uncharacterized protein n=1 Tax=Thlaspi arvense TaxID=13288 RepID=A0AAU9RT29_THLAR|nr:unnamed protein product [Thlaspi arvense]